MKEKYADYVGQPSQSLKTWKAALYIRLSKEDMEGNQSESAVYIKKDNFRLFHSCSPVKSL